jgi:hypothetical protein
MEVHLAGYPAPAISSAVRQRTETVMCHTSGDNSNRIAEDRMDAEHRSSCIVRRHQKDGRMAAAEPRASGQADGTTSRD